MKDYICEHCGREYGSKVALRRHHISKHSDIYKKNIIDLVCPICDSRFTSHSSLFHHLTAFHGLTKESFEYVYAKEQAIGKTYTKSGVCVPIDISLEMIKQLNDYNKCENLFVTQFVSYYKMITSVREYRKVEDTENFFKNVLPWKLANEKIGNSRELCDLVFPNNNDDACKLYDIYMLSKNPFVGHGGELSPFSKDFIGYKNLTDEEKAKRVREATQSDRDDRTSTQINYWVKRGLTKLQAKKMVHETHRVFSKNIALKNMVMKRV